MVYTCGMYSLYRLGSYIHTPTHDTLGKLGIFEIWKILVRFGELHKLLGNTDVGISLRTKCLFDLRRNTTVE